MITHGASAYANGRCRCPICREGNRARLARTRKRRFEQRTHVNGTLLAAVDLDGNVLPHGTPATYGNHGCRCGECRAAWSDHLAERRPPGNGRSSRGSRKAKLEPDSG